MGVIMNLTEEYTQYNLLETATLGYVNFWGFQILQGK